MKHLFTFLLLLVFVLVFSSISQAQLISAKIVKGQKELVLTYATPQSSVKAGGRIAASCDLILSFSSKYSTCAGGLFGSGLLTGLLILGPCGLLQGPAIVELSDASGSFVTSTTITTAPTLLEATIWLVNNAIIPANVPTGTNYKIRFIDTSTGKISNEAGPFTITTTPVPVVTLNKSSDITCANPTVTLIAGGATTYAFSEGATSIVPNTATVSKEGSYTVIGTTNGCSANAVTTVTSNTVAAQNVTLSSSGTLTCSNKSVNLLAGSSTPNVSYNFSGPDVSGQNGATATANQEGMYTVKVTGTNGCTATQTTQVKSNTAAPTTTLNSSGPITCSQRTVTLTAGGGGTYGFSSGATPSGNTALVSSDGLYSVTVTGTNGCTATQATQVSSNTAAPDATLNNNGPITCHQRTVMLTAGGGGTYAFSTGITANGNTATVTDGGPYSVTVTSANGCTATQTTQVQSNTTAPNATLNNTGPLTANQPTATLNASGGNTYAFSSGASQQGGGNTATVTSPGTYQVTVTSSSNGCSATASTTVTGAVSASSCRNGTGVITVIASGTPVKYEWYRNSINSARLTENPAQVRGTSTASLTLVNQQVTADYYVRVTDANGTAVVYGPFRFTVNLGCNLYARQGAEEVELRISLLGNPMQGDQLRATISGAEGKVLNVQLLDLSGKPIRAQQWQQAEGAQSVEWTMSGQSSGVYLLQATTPDQRQSVKVIK